MMKAVRFTTYGPEQLKISEDVAIPTAQYGEVLIKVVCSSATRWDLIPKMLQANDSYTEVIIGCEVAGYIHDVSQQRTTNWCKGDRVMALCMFGGNAEYVTVPETLVMPVPSTMSFKVAACIPENWLTAYQMIYMIGHVQYKDSVLIHTANSGVGTAAVQLCSIIGASCYACVSSDDTASRVIDLGATSVFNSRTQDIVDVVMKATKGVGVNLILDSVGGLFWKQNSSVIALDGKWILYGLHGGTEVNGDMLSAIIRKRITLIGSELRYRSLEYKNELVNGFISTILPRLENGRIFPVLGQVLPLSEIAKAHMMLETGYSYGKLVLQVRREEEMHKLSYRLN